MLLTAKALQPYAFTARPFHKDENLTLLILRIEIFVFFNQHKRVPLLENQSNLFSEADSLVDRGGWVPVMTIYL